MLLSSRMRNICALTFGLAIVHANWFDSYILARPQNARWIHQRDIDPVLNGAAILKPPLGTAAGSPTTVQTSTIAPTNDQPVNPTQEPKPEPKPDEPVPGSSSTLTTAPVPAPVPATTPSTSAKTDPTPTTPDQKSKSSSANVETHTATAEPSTTIQMITSVVIVSGSSFTSVSSSTVVTSNFPEATDSVPASNDNSGSSSGMNSKTKNTIIGVVVGIGGAALLAGLFVVAWRIWGRKKPGEDDSGLVAFQTGSSGHEKTSMGNTRPANPFQSTLENYHNPARVNASSNF